MENSYVLKNKYVGLVIDNNDTTKMGRVKVKIPTLTDDENSEDGIWAYPKYFHGGYKDGEPEFGSSDIPPNNSWVVITFDLSGNPNIPFYGEYLTMRTKILPENRVGNNPSNKSVIKRLKSGRAIVLSDDNSDERTELTGKKRQYSPQNGEDSVYTIINNQSVILIDDRLNNEKMIISDYHGNRIVIKTNENKIEINSTGDIHIKGESINIDSSDKICMNCNTTSITDVGSLR